MDSSGITLPKNFIKLVTNENNKKLYKLRRLYGRSKMFKTLEKAQSYYNETLISEKKLLNEYSRVFTREELQKYIKDNHFPVINKNGTCWFYRDKVDEWINNNYNTLGGVKNG